MVAIPALHLVERTFPRARRILLTNIRAQVKAPAAFAILDGSELVHDFIDYPLATRSLKSLIRVWWKILRFRPQVVVYLMTKRGQRSLERDQWFFRVCGVWRIVGLPVGNLAYNQCDPSRQIWESEAARLLRCMLPLGSADADDLSLWDLRLTAAEEARAREALARLGRQRFIACGPGTKMQAKDWGQENWWKLLTRLGDEFSDYGLVLVGAGEDAEAAQRAATGWRGPVLNLCGVLTPRETAAVLQHAELFLGPDSGPMHLAAAYGVPCAIVFAARDLAGRWYPAGKGHRIVYHAVECRHCGLEVCIENAKKCLTSVTVDEMFAAAVEAWKNGHRARDGVADRA